MQARRSAASLKLINLLRGRCIKKSELRTGYLSQGVERRVKSDPHLWKQRLYCEALSDWGQHWLICVWIATEVNCGWCCFLMCSHQALYQVCAPNKVAGGAQQTLSGNSWTVAFLFRSVCPEWPLTPEFRKAFSLWLTAVFPPLFDFLETSWFNWINASKSASPSQPRYKHWAGLQSGCRLLFGGTKDNKRAIMVKSERVKNVILSRNLNIIGLCSYW